MAKNFLTKVRGKLNRWRTKITRIPGYLHTYRDIRRQETQRPYAGQWVKAMWLQQQMDRNYLLEEPSPWLNFEVIKYLTEYLTSGIRLFEYGSGGSTLFWQKHGVICISLEHTEEWFNLIKPMLNPQLVDYRLVQPTKGVIIDNPAADDPQAYASTILPGYNLRNYVSEIDQFPDEHFDVIVIDGRARASCIVHSIPKLKPSGLLILDDADRPRYTDNTVNLLADFKQHLVFSNIRPLSPPSIQTRTDIYIK